MTKINVCEIDKQVNKSDNDLRTGIKRVVSYIKQNIDPTFPEDKFWAWLDSDSESNFRWNSKLYIWNN